LLAHSIIRETALSDLEQNKPSGALVAFLGPLGTFTHAAVDQYFGVDARKHSVATINDVFADVEAGHAQFGVVPVENSTEGAVNNTQDCLVDTSLQIIAEVVIPIDHNFLMLAGAAPEAISRIVSHRQSLAQCRAAAIAGLRAAQLYSLQVIHARIQDQQNNRTRFLVLARDGVAPTGRDKTSILIYTENKPGALFRILEPFNTYQVSLTKIETRPARDSAWAYIFFIDFEGHKDDAEVQKVFAQLQGHTAKIKQLGSYPMAKVGV
jgi:chorismate mutase/prephenate dehydratase